MLVFFSVAYSCKLMHMHEIFIEVKCHKGEIKLFC
jgi:hypothetical protein